MQTSKGGELKILDVVRDEIGMRWNGVSINIDLINGCCLACPSCAVGSIGTKRKGVMSFETFKAILDKLETECKIRHIQLYAYSDPCMHPDLHLFIEECTKRGIETWISTMLQVTNCDFEKVIEARPTEFRISFPGWNKMTYYQKNATPKRFTEKFQEVVKLPRHPETTWTMAYHLYKDNLDEMPEARHLAECHNIKGSH